MSPRHQQLANRAIDTAAAAFWITFGICLLGGVIAAIVL
jgi:hypothetical protein